MQSTVRLFAWITVALLCLITLRLDVRGDAPATLKSQIVKVTVVRGDGWMNHNGTIPKVDIPLVQLPPGKITLLGPDGRTHEHAIKPVWMATYETRWDEYEVFCAGLDLPLKTLKARYGGDRSPEWRANRVGRPFMPPYGGGDGASVGYPADCVTLRAAQKYCAWLSSHTGKRFRLPTEAEWEYACRAGGPPVRPDAGALDNVAWFAANSEDRPHRVGEKQPNAWGLYDMLGNVGEYVIRDPNDDKGLLAGGSYKDAAKGVHSGAREPYSPDWQENDPQDPKDEDWLYYTVHHVGFRVVMEE
jgi:formylglycine-generating enzyme required for sulfatase activity